MNLEDSHIVLFEKAYRNALSGEEEAEFEILIESDELQQSYLFFTQLFQGFDALATEYLAEELADYQLVQEALKGKDQKFAEDFEKGITALKIDELTSKLNAVQAEEQTKGGIFRLNRRWLMAASIALIAVFTFIIYGRLSYSDNAIARQSFAKVAVPQLRSNNQSGNYDEGIHFYSAGNYQSAIDFLQKITAESPQYFEAKFWEANAQYQLGEFRQSAVLFSQVANSSSVFSATAQWNSVLCYWRSNQQLRMNEVLANILQDQNHPYYENALKFQKKLNAPLKKWF